MSLRILRTAFFISLALTLQPTPSASSPQEPPGAESPKPAAEPKETPQPRIKPYEKVITKDSKTTSGVFKVHRIKEKLYYEIPGGELNKEFLLVKQIAKTTVGVGYGGQALGNNVLRWERRENRILLRSIAYDIVSDPRQLSRKRSKMPTTTQFYGCSLSRR